jgi:hypothetical protein
VIVSPAVARAAGPDGVLPLRVENSVVTAQIVGTTRYFPSVEGDVVVADLDSWMTAANTLDPGTTAPSEMWLQRAPARSLPREIDSHRARENELTSDPLARGSIALLVVTAIVALALAAVGLLLTVVGDTEDDALLDLEAQGATPRDLRRHVLLRAATVGTLGLGGGIAAGAVVGALVVAVVTVTAGAQTALPPLALAFDWPLVAAAVAALALAASIAAVATVRRTV